MLGDAVQETRSEATTGPATTGDATQVPAGAEVTQLADASNATPAPATPPGSAGGTNFGDLPVVEVTPKTENGEIRVIVVPGETLELPHPFDSMGDLAAKIGHGNLAIKVDDTTVVLVGYVAANDTAPVTVETSHGKPIDVATVLAQTDPNLDIQTAAGPAAGPQAAESGHLLALFGGGPGLGGFTAVGPQDQTSLSYGLIDNSIRQEFGPLTPNGEAPAVGDSSVAVNEAGLPFGSNPASNSEIASGALHIASPDAVASISIDGHAIDLSNPSKSGSISGSYGELTVTKWDPSTGELDYTYTLTDNFHHDPIQGPNVALGAEDFPVTVTDSGGQTGMGQIGIDIVDDVPTACADVATVCRCGNASGNVLANDTPGADGIAAIVDFKDGGHDYAIDASGKLTTNDSPADYSYDQTTGVLTIDHTSGGGTLSIDLMGDHVGDYSYTQGKATANDDFQYTIMDGDGDKSTADLAILAHLSPPVAHDTTIVTLDGHAIYANSWLLANDGPEGVISVAATGSEHNLTLTDLGFGGAFDLAPGKTDGSFDYTIVDTTNGKTDTASVDVHLAQNANYAIDESASTKGMVLIGDSHDNAISGGSGDDVLVGNGGKDTLSGHGGNDTLLYDGQDTFNGGAGTDRLAFGDQVNLSFDSGFTSRVHSIEVLDARNGVADSLGNAGHPLTVAAVLDMTDGKGELWIAADKGDSVTLDHGFTAQAGTIGNGADGDGIPNDTYATYTMTDGLHTAIVHVSTEAMVHH